MASLAPIGLRRGLLAVGAVAALVWAGQSYGRAVTGPGNDPIGIRTTEWLKNHHLTWAVNDVERFWYTHHQPRSGGLPTGALGRTMQGVPTPAAAANGPSPGGRHLPVPPPVVPIASALPGEGQWRPLGQPVKGAAAMYATFLRPDSVHTSLVTAVAWMDPTLVYAVGFAGAVEPGGGPLHDQAPIPAIQRPALLAAFNSGFKLRDSGGGYYADGRVVRPLRDGAATLAIRPDGTATVGQWGRDLRLGPDVTFARQNLTLIVDGGQPVPGIQTDSSARWGATLGNSVLVWRSGVGVTANGALVYAAGNGLSVGSLAAVLARAGATRAMELDINSAWVDFFTYGPPSPANAVGGLAVTKLLPDMRPPVSNYLTASSRDFIAIFGRP